MQPVSSATIRDISRGGVRLVSVMRVDPGTTIRILLKSVQEARVVHVSSDVQDQWTMGCAFTAEISAGELQQLL
jgi:hypothetical protein